MKLTQPLIQYVGLDGLDDAEKETLTQISSEYHDKIQRSMETPTTLVVTIKLHKVEGKKKKYSVRVHTIAAAITLETKHACDWDFARTLHKAFKNMERLVIHEFKADNQNKKVGTKAKMLSQLE